MASYHILYSGGEEGSFYFNVEFHIPVPDEVLPLTGANIRTLLIVDDFYIKTSNIADVGELGAIADGELVIISENVKVNSNLSNAQIRNKIRDRYDELEVIAINNLRLRYKGYSFQETKGSDF